MGKDSTRIRRVVALMNLNFLGGFHRREKIQSAIATGVHCQDAVVSVLSAVDSASVH